VAGVLFLFTKHPPLIQCFFLSVLKLLNVALGLQSLHPASRKAYKPYNVSKWNEGGGVKEEGE